MQTESQLTTPQISIDRAVIIQPSKGRKQALRELTQVVAELRQEAEQKGLDNMPMKEINRAVAAARRDMRKTSKNNSK